MTESRVELPKEYCVSVNTDDIQDAVRSLSSALYTLIEEALMGAMLNITRPWWPKEGVVRVTDPMVGSGTTLLEALKFTERGDSLVTCADVDPLCQVVARDNFDFFSLSRDRLVSLRDFLFELQINSCGHEPPRIVQRPPASYGVAEAHSWADDFLERITNELEAGKYISNAHLEELRNKRLEDRLIFLPAFTDVQTVQCSNQIWSDGVARGI